MTKHTIDAKGKAIGRVASQAAHLLMGKDEPGFRRNLPPAVTVNIVNASKIYLHPKKAQNKIYKRYSGYPGGLKELSLKDVAEKKGYSEILRLAVNGMLPKNTLRAKMLKQLTVSE